MGMLGRIVNASQPKAIQERRNMDKMDTVDMMDGNRRRTSIVSIVSILSMASLVFPTVSISLHYYVIILCIFHVHLSERSVA